MSRAAARSSTSSRASAEPQLSGSGQPLSRGARKHFEATFGFDFGRVRIHADEQAGELSRRHGARALTFGNDIAFARDRYRPDTAEGRALLAHELTHVVQQRRAGRRELALQDDEAWIQDRDGDLFFNTREEAERRLQRLQREGQFREFRVQSFQQGGQTRFRVLMRGRVQRGESRERERAAERSAERERREAAPPRGESSESEAGSGGGNDGGGGKAGKGGSQPSGAGRTICLTFDDGPQTGTGDVLDVLEAAGVPATFFLTGQNMAGRRTQQTQFDLVERMVQSPLFKIGNHTFTHDPATRAGYRSAYGNIASSSAQQQVFDRNYSQNRQHFERLFQARGRTFPGFSLARLPGDGRTFPELVQRTEQLGMRHVSWSFEFAPNRAFGHVANQDWQQVQGVAATGSGLPSNLAIVLFHDRHWAGANRAKFQSLVRKLRTLGFSFGQLNDRGQCAAFQRRQRSQAAPRSSGSDTPSRRPAEEPAPRADVPVS